MLTLQRLAEKGFVVLSLLFFTGALNPYISDENPLNPNPLYPLKEALPTVCLVVTCFLIAARWKRVVSIVIREQLLWILMGIALGSVSWSDQPIVTQEHVMPLLRVTIFGVYFGTRYRMREQVWILTWMFGLVMFLSLLLCVAVPSYGVVGRGFIANLEDVIHTGAWRGVYIHKNIMGGWMILSAVIFCTSALCNYKYRQILWAGCGFSIFFILKSTTKTALVLLFVIVILLPLYRALRWNYTKALPFFITMVLIGGSVAVMLVGSAETLLGAIGGDITLTGRTEIWPLVIEEIKERPWLGYGYETFWANGWEGEAADIWRGLNKGGFEPTHAHNGFLEICLSFGLVGFGAFVLSFLAVFIRAVSWLRQNETAEGFLPLVYLTVMLMLNLTESLLMNPDFYWLFYVAITLSMYYKSATNSIDVDYWWHQVTRKESISSTPQGALTRRALTLYASGNNKYSTNTQRGLIDC